MHIFEHIFSSFFFQTYEELAMPRRTKSTFTAKYSESEVTISDVTCIVCCDFFTNPVLLPCNHRLCEDCLLLIVDKSNVECPSCRSRLTTWVRTNKFVQKGVQGHIDQKFIPIVEKFKTTSKIREFNKNIRIFYL